MRHRFAVFLAVLLGFFLGLSAPVIAADRADDWHVIIDRESAGPVVNHRLEFAQHVDLSPADWGALRGAAAQSQAAFDGWFTGKGWGAWWATYTPAQHADARQAVLLGAP